MYRDCLISRLCFGTSLERYVIAHTKWLIIVIVIMDY